MLEERADRRSGFRRFRSDPWVVDVLGFGTGRPTETCSTTGADCCLLSWHSPVRTRAAVARAPTAPLVPSNHAHGHRLCIHQLSRTPNSIGRFGDAAACRPLQYKQLCRVGTQNQRHTTCHHRDFPAGSAVTVDPSSARPAARRLAYRWTIARAGCPGHSFRRTRALSRTSTSCSIALRTRPHL
ncbi:hypothetical protein BCR34DRAFT_3005 [Clohesyomyces aquaticus]|uniref:Uncharacterized protein n=1 Tax=Clohesyomyces aquaticus TaxID=1231657 RepID=A0A1Y2ABV1_9PLEO|nr:hypothetical protein BCR34DRAFT_3005 [Clohesyomyces aquaticus]